VSQWHVPEDSLLSYARGQAGVVDACSTEAHLALCPACRSVLARESDSSSFDTTWSAIVDELDAPRRNGFERVLTMAGVTPTTARLMAATPTLRLAWMASVLAAVAISVISSRLVKDNVGLFLFAAPLVPLLAVAVAFGPRTEPTHEIAIAASFDKVRLVAVRSAVVFGSALVALALGSLVIRSVGPAELSWLLPALALVSVCLCLMTWMSGIEAALIGGAGWMVLVVVTTGWHHLLDIAERCLVFQPPGQLAATVVLTLAVAITVRRREAFNLPGLM